MIDNIIVTISLSLLLLSNILIKSVLPRKILMTIKEITHSNDHKDN
jgi:hypothetical protein